MASQQTLKQIIKEEYSKCIKDSAYFMRRYCMIQHPTRGKIPFDLYDFQEDVLDDFQNERYNVILKARQLGLSTLTAGYSLWLMLFHADKNILVIATKQEVAKNLVTKVRVMHDNLPSWLKGKCIEDNQIKAVSSSVDAGRSEALSLLILDEAAFIDKVEEIWTASQQTLATGGAAVILSTPNGVGNFFHKTWIDAEAGINGFNTIKLHWSIHPDREQDWRDEQDVILGEKMAAQECDTDFITSGNTVVDPTTLQFYEQTHVRDPLEKKGFDGNLWVWDYPNYTKDYIVSADVARGDASDWSAFHVLDVETLEQVAEYRGKVGTKDFGNMCVNISTEYNDALLVIENTNIGWAAIQPAIDRQYKNLFYSTKDLTVVDTEVQLRKGFDLKAKEKLVPGFTTSAKTRPLIISKLDTYFREKSVLVRSKRLIDELFVFIWNGQRAEAQRGYNDDLVMAYCIGLWVRDTAFRLRQEGMALQRKALSSFTTGHNSSAYSNPEEEDAWKWDVQGEQESLEWLIK